VRQFLFRVFVSVEAELGVIGEVRAELQEEGPKVAVHAVDVEVVHHGRRAHQPRIGGIGRFTPPPLGAKHRPLLLCFADEHHSLSLPERPSLLGGHVILALALAERNHRNLFLPGKCLQSRHECFADRIHQGAGGELVATMKTKEAGHPLLALQSRDVNVQLHPVDSFHLQGDVLGKHFVVRSFRLRYDSDPSGSTAASAA
jgi:hypothetical protein